MSKPSDKPATPAYASLKTLTTYLNECREKDHIPLRIDRSEMPKASGSVANETIAALQFLGLTNEKNEPTALFKPFVIASDEDRRPLLAQIIKSSYPFLFDVPGFDIERASSAQVAEKFREKNISGGTVSRAMAFFLQATKVAGIKVSPNIKPPPITRSAPSKLKKEKAPPSFVNNGEGGSGGGGGQPTPPTDSVDSHRFELPIPGKRPVIVSIPNELNGDDWEMFSQMFTIYVKHWKNFQGQEQQKTRESTEEDLGGDN